MGCGAMIPKPSGDSITPDVVVTAMHSAGSLPRHRRHDQQKPPDTQVRGIGKVNAETGDRASENGGRKSRRSTVETGTNPKKQKPVSQHSL